MIESSSVKESVRQQFSTVAVNYSTSSVHASGADLAQMVKAVQLSGREQVLDAGCGAGHTALTFAPHVQQVTAFDLSDEMLAQVRRLASERTLTNIETRKGDVENLPFENASFDLVTSRYSAHHWPNPQRALREIRRVLKPGSYFLLSDIVSYDDFTSDTFLQTIELLRDPSHVRDHSVAQWIDMLRDAGFSATLEFSWGVWLDFADWTKRMATPPDQVAMLRKIMDLAPHEARQALQIEADHNFTIQGGLIRALVTA